MHLHPAATIPLVFLASSLFILPAATAQQAVPSNLIHTHAMAHARLANTVADATVGITEDGPTVAAVSKTLGERSQKLLTYLRAQHAERLVTNQVSVEPKTHTVKGGPDVIVGYTGRISVSFRTTADKASQLTTDALANGANTLDQVSFSPAEEETETARKNLAIEATRSALAQAEAVAKAVGGHVTAVRDIAVDPEGSFFRPMAMARQTMAAMKAQAGPPIATEAGDQEVSVIVNLDAVLAQ